MSVSTDSKNSTSITITWAVDCIHRNGNITGYLVRYGEHGEKTFVTVARIPDHTHHTISGLASSTSYDIEVAVVNSRGRGPYSSSLTVKTEGAVKHGTYINANFAATETCPKDFNLVYLW